MALDKYPLPLFNGFMEHDHHLPTNYHKKALRRLSIITGQIEGLKRMVTAGAYCPEIITQSLSVQESLKGFNGLLLENHLRTHVTEQIAAHEIEKVVTELLGIYKLNQKK